MLPVVIAAITGVVGLGVAALMAAYVLKRDEGPARVKEISAAIKEGAMAFLGREYRVLAIVLVVVAIVLAVVPDLGWMVSAAFVFGALCSASAGFIGMNIAVRANGRTAAAARESLNHGLRVSFRAGAVMGMSVVSIGLVGVSVLFFVFGSQADFVFIIPAYGFGASSVAIFARVGGGIFTKAADTGADIVGKIEKGIPEDDPRNAAVIADFVGDNVGDVAGMGADLFESYVGSIVATVTLATLAVASAPAAGSVLFPNEDTARFLPLVIAAAGVIASIVGIFLVRVGEKPEMRALLNALRRGVFSSAILAAVLAVVVIIWMDAHINVFWAILAGLAAGVLIGESTNYFTSYSYRPTLNIAKSSQTGAATLLTTGLANGLMSTVPPIILTAAAILVAYYFAGIYGVAIAGVGMLATLGIQDATDAYGPVADNSGGIVEMSHFPPEIRQRTDALDSLGNTTAATGKGFAIGSAGLTALALLLSYTQAVGLDFAETSLLEPNIIVGIFLGAMIPTVFCAMTLNAVGKTSFSIINEVRRQFKEIPGLMEGTAKPDYAKSVDICTKAALKQMLAPGILALVSPVIVALVIGPRGVAGFLVGAIAMGFILAVTFANAGGSWDNAKKWIETGAHGGKGSESHKAAVVGDTVGDPMKDTSGPSLNILIKLMAILSLVLAPVIAKLTGIL